MGNQQAQQKCPCNFTLGFFSISPQLMVTIKNNEIDTNISIINYLLSVLTIPGFRLILKNIGDASDPRIFSQFERGEVEFLPHLYIMAYSTSAESISPVTLGSPIKMVSLSPKVEYSVSDWIGILNIIDKLVWVAFLIILLVVSIILSRRLRDSHKQITKNGLFRVYNAFWSTLAASANQTSITHGPRILLLCFSLFIFFLWALFNGNVNTDLIVGKEPFRIDSMEDVLKPEASEFQPRWRKEFNLHKSFEYSNPSSVRGKIWRKAIVKGIDEALIKFEDFTEASAPRLKHQKTILFDGENLIKTFALYSCHWMFDKGDVHISDGDAGEELLVFPLKFQNDSCYTVKRKKIPKIFLNFFESGQFEMIMGPKNFLLQGVRNPMARFQCPVLEKRTSKGIEYNQVSVANIPSLFGLYFVCLLACGAVFLLELAYSHLRKLIKRPLMNDQEKKVSPKKDSDASTSGEVVSRSLSL